ncbi:uncharacterized protein LODBEIA_P40440 [Lodderomyces beijingensis]|uniref:Zn(2)-C6 fungal-type domain-containing protein n=1 Tax=Lodderomyces beijingensis TaxID=1775926 RepID=A0ABP0ZNU1_9ASCO
MSVTEEAHKKPYSRGGCRECKRRKIRCPEQKPSCQTCVRLGKTCSYPLAGEKVLRISRRLIRDEIENLGKSTHFLPVQYDMPKRAARSKVSSDHEQVMQFTENKQQDQINSLGGGGVGAGDVQKRSALNIENLINDNTNMPKNGPSGAGGEQFDFLSGTDLNILTTDLSNFVNELMEYSNLRPFQDDFQFDFWNTNTANPPLMPHQEPLLHNDEEFIVNLPLDYIKLKRKHEVLYLEQFYNNFANIIEPFDAYNPATKCISNPARDIILKTASTEPFLLAAVLAEGAKTSYMKYSQPEDEKAYGAYLSKCLKLLEPAKKEQVNDLSANIEAVLLTLLLLTAATATSTQQWRPHLTGCKDLLLKISTQTNSPSTHPVSRVFVFCKYWFLSIEILAGLSTNLGGTLQTDTEIDQLMSDGSDYEISVLKEMGIITEQGFNILMGYHNTVISSFRDLLKLLNQHRKNQDSIDPFQNMNILAEFYNQARMVYLDSAGIVPESELQLKYTPGLPIEEIRVGEQIYWLSWQDISHQAFVLSSIVMILTRFFQLSATNPNVSLVVDKLVSFIHYLHEFSDVQQHASPFLLLMIQWPLLVSGLESTKREQQQLLLKYFAMVGQIGASTANISVQMLQKRWGYVNVPGTRTSDGNGDALIY